MHLLDADAPAGKCQRLQHDELRVLDQWELDLRVDQRYLRVQRKWVQRQLDQRWR
jgi:hypothetical protein